MSDLHPELRQLAKQAQSLQAGSVALTQTLIAWLDWDGFTVLIDRLFQRLGCWLVESHRTEAGPLADFSASQRTLNQLAYIQLAERPNTQLIERLVQTQTRNSHYQLFFIVAQHQSSALTENMPNLLCMERL